MPTGTCKFFRSDRGFGFISPDGGGKDVFVHIGDLALCGFTGTEPIAEGDRLTFDVVESKRKPGYHHAVNLRRAG
jgi:cold shock protein